MTYQMQEARVGSKWTPGYRKAKDIAADIRSDLKAAQKDGTIPADVKISVRTRTYAGGRAIDVTLSGWAQDRIREGEGFYMTPEADRVQRAVNHIREAYNRNASDPMVDYFDVDYYGSVTWDYDYS
jgi:hypothetical protein